MKISLSLYLIIILTSLSCKHADDIFKSYGEETVDIRSVGNFDKIIAGEKFDIILIQDSILAGTVEMYAGKNVIDGYTTTVNNGELRIANDNKFNWVRKLNIRQKVIVYFAVLNQIQINGSAKFTCKDSIINKSTIEINHGGLEDAEFHINGDYIYINCTNTGGVTVKGSCFLLSASIDDISFVNSFNLQAEKAFVTSFSQDNSFVHATDELEIRLYGNGNVYFRENPSNVFKTEAQGNGKILKY